MPGNEVTGYLIRMRFRMICGMRFLAEGSE